MISGVKPGMIAWEEEIFGPIAAITAFDTDFEAISMVMTPLMVFQPPSLGHTNAQLALVRGFKQEWFILMINLWMTVRMFLWRCEAVR